MIFIRMKSQFKSGTRFVFVFFQSGFFSRAFTIHMTAGQREAICLCPLYHFQPPHRHLDISRMIPVDSSSLHITCSLTQTGNLWFPSACYLPLNYRSLNTYIYLHIFIHIKETYEFNFWKISGYCPESFQIW